MSSAVALLAGQFLTESAGDQLTPIDRSPRQTHLDTSHRKHRFGRLVIIARQKLVQLHKVRTFNLQLRLLANLILRLYIILTVPVKIQLKKEWDQRLPLHQTIYLRLLIGTILVIEKIEIIVMILPTRLLQLVRYNNISYRINS